MNNFDTRREYPIVIEGNREETASLLAKVLGITAVGFLITSFGVATAPAGGSMIGFLAVLGLIFGINFTRKQSAGLALGLFFALSYFMGWEIGPLVQHYARTLGPDFVLRAAGTTGLGMAAMGCFAYLFQVNYRKIWAIGFVLLIGLMLVGIVSIFVHFLTPDAYSWMVLGIFTLLTVGDFARIRAGGDGMSAVSLALTIYLDAINIFLAVLQLMGGGRRRD